MPIYEIPTEQSSGLIPLRMLEPNTGITLVDIGNLKNVPQFASTGVSSVDSILEAIPTDWDGVSDFRLFAVFQTTGTSGGNLHINFKYGLQGSNESIDGSTFTRTTSNDVPISSTSGNQVIVKSEIIGMFSSDVDANDTFFCQLEIDRNDAGNSNTDAINLLGLYLIYNDSITLDDQGALLISPSTLVLWKMENTSANGNETGYKQGSSGGTLDLNYVQGTINGAVTTSPPTNGVDDGLYREWIYNASTSPYMQAQQVFLSSALTNFTIDVVFQIDDIGQASHYLINNSVSPSTAGFLVWSDTADSFKWNIYFGGSQQGVAISNASFPREAQTWYHMVCMKNGNDYHVGVSKISTQGHIKTATDFTNLPSVQKAVATNATAWSPATAERVGYIATFAQYAGVIDWVRFSDSALYI